MTAMIWDIGILSHETQCCLMFGHVVGVGACKRGGLPVWFTKNRLPKINHQHQVEWTISCDISPFFCFFSPSTSRGCEYKPVRLATHFGFTDVYFPWSHGIPRPSPGSLEPDNISSHQNLGTLYLAVRHSKCSLMVIIDDLLWIAAE